jgi:protein SCO1/2
MRFLLLTLLALFLFTSCSSESNQNVTSPNAKRYPMKGKVISVDKAAKKAKVDHEKIEGFMDRMTMDFPIRADWVWSELTPGAEITADLVVDSTAKDPYWLENISITSAAKPGQDEPAVNENFAQDGNQVPNFSLTDQDGKKFSFDRYKGKALAITFIYARCPLPDYCIRMSTAFSDLALQLAKEPEAAKNIRLLSISFDPANDTAEKLRSYGLGYLGKDAKPDFTVWQLAVGPDEEVKKIADFFGLRYEVDQNDKTQYIHSLRTAVISPEGKLVKIFPGGDWTVSQLREELEASLEPQS